mgnify:FL=1
MKRIVSLFLMLALILSLSAGVAEEKTVIHFWHCHSGAVAESHQFLVDKFNASQDKIEVVLEFQANNYYDLNSKVKTAMTTGTAPEVSLGESMTMANLANTGAIQPLESYIANDPEFNLEDYAAGVMTNTYVKGKLYGLPYQRSTAIMYTNKTLLQAAGLDPAGPKTFDELIEYCKALTKNDVIGWVQPVTTWTYEAIVNGYGGSMMDPSNTEITFNSEKAIKAMELYRQGISEGWANIKVGGTATADARLEFQNQRSGFIVESTGSLKMLMGYAEGMGFELGACMIPGENSAAGGCNLVMVNGISEEKAQAAWTFMKFMNSYESALHTTRSTGYLPILRSVIAGPEMAELYAENDIYAVAAAQTEHIRSRPVHEGYNEVNTEMLNVLTELIMDTKIDAKEALDEFAEEANEILASY